MAEYNFMSDASYMAYARDVCKRQQVNAIKVFQFDRFPWAQLDNIITFNMTDYTSLMELHAVGSYD